MEYSHLTRAERNKVYEGKCQKKPSNRIAKELGRDKSTISRELRRNSDAIGYLYPYQADELAKQRRYKPILTKIGRDMALRDFIIEQLKERLSPKMIAVLWRKKTPDKKISKESIYNFVYSNEGVEKGLPKLLVRAKKKRGFVYQTKKASIKGAISIHARPQEINERKTPGHYEGDLIFNEGSMSQNILTLIDRATRESIMIFNESKHTNVVLGNLIKHIKEKPIPILSITFDNGTEFAGHAELNKLGIKTYFCDPGKPYQKGSIENLNGVTRRYLPFGLQARCVTSQLVQDAMIKVNNLPREILGWLSASEYAQSIYQGAFSS